MRVKLFVNNESFLARNFSSSEEKSAAQVEAQVNAWLEANPGIRVVEIRQSNSAGAFGPHMLWVSIWYESDTE